MDELVSTFMDQLLEELKSSLKGYISQEYNSEKDEYKLYVARKDVTYRFKLDRFSERITKGQLTVWSAVNMIEHNYKRVLIDSIFFKKGELKHVAVI